MILAMDVGNTNIKCGIFDDKELKSSWRLATTNTSTADEYGVSFMNLLRLNGSDPTQIDSVIISSVVPSLNYTLEHMIRYFFKVEPLVVGPGVRSGINIKYENPRDVGSDRIVNAVAAYELYGGPCIIIDFGTATTFGAISQNGEFLGGCICPGIRVATEALVQRADRLPRIEFIRPETVINRTTISNMQAGVIYGFIGQVEYIVRKMKKELGAPDAKVVATGGMAYLVAGESASIDEINSFLTLEGLRIIAERNRPREEAQTVLTL